MKRAVVGDFVTHTVHEGSWMITDIVFNYELNVRQARIIKVGNPKHVEHVDPASLSVIKKTF
jgi:hypothetical protein